MARAISTEDANRLIVTYQSLLKNSRILADRFADLRKRVDNEGQAVLRSRALSESIQEQLAAGDFSAGPQACETALAKALVRYVQFSGQEERFSDIREKYEAENAALLRSLSTAASPLKWFFAGRKSKEQAEAAYYELQNRATDEYGLTIADCWKAFSQDGEVPAERAYAMVSGNRRRYLDAVRRCCPRAEEPGGLGEFGENTRRFAEAYGRYRESIRKHEKEKQLKDKKEDVLAWLRKAEAEQAMKDLAGYDVESLNQVKPGIRVKALRDAGYDTAAKVFTAPAYALSTVHGIGMESARTVKEAADEIARTVLQNVKLKLSADEKTPGKSGLMASLLVYSRISRMIEKYEGEINGLLESCGVNPEEIPVLRNNIDWMFFGAGEKKAVREAYGGMVRLLGQNFEELVKNYGISVTQSARLDEEAAWEDFSKDPYRYYNLLEELAPGALGGGGVYGLPEDLAREIQDQQVFPDGLKVTLRRYQEWGVKYILHQGKALLGDEMGLGKTVQAIAAMVSLRNTGARRFMVVCPASILPNWCREIASKSCLDAIRVHGPSRANALAEWIEKGGVAVTTYDTLNSVELPEGFLIDLLVADEAHFIKNENALRTKNVRRVGAQAGRILFMTGTALENNVEEMISLIRMLQPAVAYKAKKIAFMSAAPQFREAVAPVYYRRRREDVLTELPDITEVREWCDLSPAEKAVYRQAVRAGNRTAIRRVSWNVDDISQSAKAKRMLEIIQDAEEDGRRVIVFSFYLETIRRVTEFLGSRCAEPVTGAVPAERRQEIIDRFDAMPAGSVLPAQIQAGGTGLNIQTASVVIICEPQLKPSVENQAVSRAYRMGQTRKVLVYHLLASGTIDEKIDEMLARKQNVFDVFADLSAAAAATEQEEKEIDDKTFGRLIQEEIDKINLESGGGHPEEQKGAGE